MGWIAFILWPSNEATGLGPCLTPGEATLTHTGGNSDRPQKFFSGHSYPGEGEAL